MTDIAVVGRFAGSQALGSVGSTTIFVTLMTGFLIGLGGGVNVLVARFYGAEQPKDVEKSVHSALLVCLAAGVLLLVVGVGLFAGADAAAGHKARPDRRGHFVPAHLFSGDAGHGHL